MLRVFAAYSLTNFMAIDSDASHVHVPASDPVLPEISLSYLKPAEFDDESIDQGRDLQYQVMSKICQNRDINPHVRRTSKKRSNKVV